MYFNSPLTSKKQGESSCDSWPQIVRSPALNYLAVHFPSGLKLEVLYRNLTPVIACLMSYCTRARDKLTVPVPRDRCDRVGGVCPTRQSNFVEAIGNYVVIPSDVGETWCNLNVVIFIYFIGKHKLS